MRRAGWAAAIQLGFAFAAAVPASAQTGAATDLPAMLSRLIAAYPAQLERIDGNALVWKDGTRMPIDDGKGVKDHEVRLATSDIKDMFFTPYVAGKISSPPARNEDPGRARNVAFFDKVYGDCKAGGVSGKLVEVVWLPKKWGKPLKVSSTNGAAEKLAAVSAELDALPARFDPFLTPPAGTYNCRPIAGTTRLSAHGHGIAIDISTAHAHYWRWSGGKTSGGEATGSKPPGGNTGAVIPYKNSIPPEIVEIFERHGFIWGGKWYHYDTMHFEYRPELLPPAR